MTRMFTRTSSFRDLQTEATTLVSVNPAGTASGDAISHPVAVTPDGRYILFYSQASNLVNNDTNGFADAFMRDMQAGTTALVSVNLAGTNSGNDHSWSSNLTPDGRYAVFFSDASDLVANDTDGVRDAFVRDMQAGTTTLVSLNLAATGSGNDSSSAGAITPDGRYILFESSASNLVPSDTNGRPDIFVRDQQAGTTTLVSVNSSGTGSGNSSSSTYLVAYPITPDGRYILFSSAATDLVPSDDLNTKRDVFLRDQQAGTTALVSVNLSGTTGATCGGPPGNALGAGITSDGRYALFSSCTPELVAEDTNEFFDVFVRDIQAGANVSR